MFIRIIVFALLQLGFFSIASAQFGCDPVNPAPHAVRLVIDDVCAGCVPAKYQSWVHLPDETDYVNVFFHVEFCLSPAQENNMQQFFNNGDGTKDLVIDFRVGHQSLGVNCVRWVWLNGQPGESIVSNGSSGPFTNYRIRLDPTDSGRPSVSSAIVLPGFNWNFAPQVDQTYAVLHNGVQTSLPYSSDGDLINVLIPNLSDFMGPCGRKDSGLDDLSEKEKVGSLLIAPNPVNAYLNVALPLAGEVWSVEVYSVDGKPVLQQRSDTQYFEIDCSDLPAGVYHLRATSGELLEMETFVKH